MTELSFLLDLLLEEKLSKAVQLKIKDRIKEIEIPKVMTTNVIYPIAQTTSVVSPTQAPSTLAAMARQEVTAPLIKVSPPGALINNGDGTVGKKKW